jgi:hypothetical protein
MVGCFIVNRHTEEIQEKKQASRSRRTANELRIAYVMHFSIFSRSSCGFQKGIQRRLTYFVTVYIETTHLYSYKSTFDLEAETLEEICATLVYSSVTSCL